MEPTGVFATEEQAEKIEHAISDAEKTPVMLLGGTDMSAAAWRGVQNLCHRFALENGLTDSEVTYSYDRETKEFYREREV
jgi:hypothetical protein